MANFPDTRVFVNSRFLEFMSQPLRARQKKALQHLLDLLRESGSQNQHGGGASSSHLSGMDTGGANANTPIP